MNNRDLLLGLVRDTATIAERCKDMATDLKEHMRRTAQNEIRIEHVESMLLKEVAWRKGALRVLGWLVGVATAAGLTVIGAIIKGIF